MSGTGILPHTALAATNHGEDIRVYFQAYDGYLRESGYDPVKRSWSTTKEHLPAPVKPKTFTPIACVSRDNLSKVHVFYLDIHDVISELVYDGHHWAAGELNRHNFTAASYSQLAAILWDGEIRVYYQKADGNGIHELVKSGAQKWVNGGGTGQQAVPGSRLAAIRNVYDTYIRVYFQAPNNQQNISRQVTTKKNHSWEDVQSISPPVENPVHGAYSAITYGKSDVKVFYQKVDSKLYEAGGSGNPSSWVGGSSGLVDYIPQTFLASINWGDSDADVSNIRIYGQSNGNTIQELMWRKGRGWEKGHVVPTG